MSAASIQLIRHATLRITYGDTIVLVDPMFSEIGALPPVPDSPNSRNNPLVRLPVAVDDALAGAGLVLLTHTHRDHWDDAAVAAVPKAMAVRCQPPDLEKIRAARFTGAAAVESTTTEAGIEITRTTGRHGSGDVGQRMGPVSGYVLKKAGLPTIYIAGDTIWCPPVQAAIAQHKPDVIVVNAGAAQFNTGGPITMTSEDVASARAAAPDARVIAVHMNAWNHCVLTRAQLRDELRRAGASSRVTIPDDSENVRID